LATEPNAFFSVPENFDRLQDMGHHRNALLSIDQQILLVPVGATFVGVTTIDGPTLMVAPVGSCGFSRSAWIWSLCFFANPDAVASRRSVSRSDSR
jgi:hypothetical protein